MRSTLRFIKSLGVNLVTLWDGRADPSMPPSHGMLALSDADRNGQLCTHAGTSMIPASKFRFIRYGLAFAMTLLSQACFAADADNGSRLAHRWCEACHIVDSAQGRTSTDAAPPFPTIAARPGFNAATIALFLLEPHPKMPNMSLTRIEVADLAAYIGSLAK